ncbi:MAG: DUF4386 domain-containing protein [Acidobacteriota bacterium]
MTRRAPRADPGRDRGNEQGFQSWWTTASRTDRDTCVAPPILSSGQRCSLAATIVGYLWLKSSYIPRALAVFGVISSAWCAVCIFVLYLFPDFTKVVNLWWFDSPMATFEMATSFWLPFKGLRPSGIAEPDRAVAGAA